MSIEIKTLSNGLTVIVEEMPHLRSAAYSLNIPAGIVMDDQARVGSCLLLTELTTRGAGKYNSRELTEQFENLGVRRSEGAGRHLVGYAGSVLSENLSGALELLSLMLLEPWLPADEVDNIRNLLLLDIQSLEDNPARKVMVELNKRYFPDVYSRPTLGTKEGLQASNLDSLRADYDKKYSPAGSILSVAGAVKATEVFSDVERLFSKWTGVENVSPDFGSVSIGQTHHISSDSAQLQIALAYPSVKLEQDGYYAARVLNGIMSGGMFGRLFIEVREKRGLCYSVYSSHSGTTQHGCVKAYAGTTPERAQETLDVLVAELKAVPQTISDQELDRAKANLKSILIMSEESSGARASSNASDWWWLKRIRSLEEIQTAVDKVGADDIYSHFEQYTPDNIMLVTLGSQQLEL